MKYMICVFALFGNLVLQADNNRFSWDDWATHQPVLHAVATATKGPIIEFGCGYGSTDLLHEICEKEGRILITIEDNLEWMSRFTSKYEGKGYNPDNSGWHKFFFVPGKNLADIENPAHWVKFMDELDLLNEIDFDVCFIDQGPWLARHETVKRMKDKARFVIVHDIDFFPVCNIFGKVVRPTVNRTAGEFDFQDTFSEFHVYFPNHPWPADTGPPTLLGSNFETVFPPVDYSKKIVISEDY